MTKDIFKKAKLKSIGHGGFRCPCCNQFRTNKKKNFKKLNRIARARLKENILKYEFQS